MILLFTCRAHHVVFIGQAPVTQTPTYPPSSTFTTEARTSYMARKMYPTHHIQIATYHTYQYTLLNREHSIFPNPASGGESSNTLVTSMVMAMVSGIGTDSQSLAHKSQRVKKVCACELGQLVGSVDRNLAFETRIGVESDGLIGCDGRC